MEFNPPVGKRTTKELFNIISNDKRWIKEIQLLANEELLKRGISLTEIEREKGKRMEILKRVEERNLEIRKKHEVESYSKFEMLSIFLFAPLNLLLSHFHQVGFFELHNGNYKKKFRQRMVLYLISTIVWIAIIYFLV